MNQLKNNQDIKNLFEQEEDYFKPVRGGGGGTSVSKNYIEYE